MIFMGKQLLVYNQPENEPEKETQRKAYMFVASIFHWGSQFRGENTDGHPGNGR